MRRQIGPPPAGGPILTFAPLRRAGQLCECWNHGTTGNNYKILVEFKI